MVAEERGGGKEEEDKGETRGRHKGGEVGRREKLKDRHWGSIRMGKNKNDTHFLIRSFLPMVLSSVCHHSKPDTDWTASQRGRTQVPGLQHQVWPLAQLTTPGRHHEDWVSR